MSDLAIERAGDGALEGLEAESLNFLQYARLQSIEDLMGDNESVIFAELIPTDGGTRTMAAQAFHHVLGGLYALGDGWLKCCSSCYRRCGTCFSRRGIRRDTAGDVMRGESQEKEASEA